MNDYPQNKMAQQSKILNQEFLFRVLSAIVLGPIAVIAVWNGGFFFLTLIIVGVFLMLHEWFRIVQTGQYLTTNALIAAVICLGCILLGSNQPIPAAIAIILGIAGVLLLPSYSGKRDWISIGVAYALLSGISLLSLRRNPDGQHIVIGLFILVWTTDIGGYFFGKIFGGPKLWLRVSPNKTWSGAIGGLLFSITALLLAAWLTGYQNLGKIAVLAILLSCVAQLGDLGESAVKRKFNVKDSGNTIPGHGGLLDRIDGLVAAAIAAHAIDLLYPLDNILG